MNTIKRYLGIVWMILGPSVILFMLQQAFEKVGIAYQKVNILTDEVQKSIALGDAHNTILQWSIIILVFVPIAIGMVIFGKYCFNGEYDDLSNKRIA